MVLVPEGHDLVFSTDRTCFYAEQGGQVSDTGKAEAETGAVEIVAVVRRGDHILHRGRVVRGKILSHQKVTLQVAPERRGRIMQNHTATHVLNWALREVLEIGPRQVIAVGEVLVTHIRDAFVADPDKLHVDTAAMQLIGRMHGAGTYLRNTDTFTMTRPVFDPARVGGDER